jgi:diamine N-acetyltransferase
MVSLEPITVDNVEECLRLTLMEPQREFIASNAYSLCEAYALTNHELYTPMPFAIYHEDRMVGFVMAIYQPQDANDPEDDEDVYYLARIMIDQAYQGRGYGKAALQQDDRTDQDLSPRSRNVYCTVQQSRKPTCLLLVQIPWLS